MNKLEDFTEGSEWVTQIGIKLKFHSFDRHGETPLFTCDEKHPYSIFNENDLEPVGTIGFYTTWTGFTKIESK